MYQPTLKKILCVTYCHPVHNDLKLSKTCYPKLNLCLIETDCYSWINRWYPGCWSLTSSTVAWLLAWARVLACVTCWPPGCTLPALPPLRLSHHYHICSTHPSFNCSHLYHTYFVQLLILILLLSLPPVFVIFNSPRCFHLVYFKMNRGEGQQSLTLFYDLSFMIQSIFPDSVFGGCCVSGPYIHDLINPYYPDIGSLPYEEYDCVVSFL